jgi:hypothetical protein
LGGGLPEKTLTTLLSSAEPGNDEPTAHKTAWEEKFVKPAPVPVRMTMPQSVGPSPDTSDSTAVGDGLRRPYRSGGFSREYSFGQRDSSVDTCGDRDDDRRTSAPHAVPVHDQRTLLISNLSDRTTHKDLVDVIRGGRLLDIYLRNDRSATVSFVEGAQDFLSWVKKNDLYLNAKRVRLPEPAQEHFH